MVSVSWCLETGLAPQWEGARTDWKRKEGCRQEGLGACHWPEAMGHEKGWGDRKRTESYSAGLVSGPEGTGKGGPKDT